MTLGDLSRFFAGIVNLGTSAADPPPLPELDARVRGAVDALPVTLFEVDARGIYTCAAGAYLRLFGISSQSLRGRSIFDFPRFVPGKNMMVRRALAGEAVSFSGIWPRGRFMMQLVPRFDERGRVAAVVGLGYELAKPTNSDRYFEELLDALRRSEGRFRAMCDCAPLGICVADAQLGLQYVNPWFAELLERTPAELHGRGWEDALHPEERARVAAARAAGGAPVVDGMIRFRSRAGATIWTAVRTAAMRDEGELLGYVAVVADITKERSAKLATAAARDDLRRVIEGSPVGIAVVRDRRWLFVNTALVRTLSYECPEALLQQEVSAIVHHEDRALLDALFAPSGRGAEREPPVVRCRSAAGEYLLLELRASSLSEFEGAPAILVSAHDVTQQRRLHARLAVTERLLAVGTLAAGVAHEINNPLAAALCNLEWASAQLAGAVNDHSEPRGAGGDGLRARLLRPIDEAREACERVRGIVQDLKLLSRAEEEQLGPVDLERVLDAAVRMAWNELRHRARLVRSYGELPRVHGNEARLGQVFLNLLINATQAIPEACSDDHVIRVSARALAGTIMVEVTDTGCGIPESTLGRIFDPFFTTKPPGVGTGLGLSICQRLVTEMGGQIEVESEPGRGSTFRVTLAIAEDAKPAPAEEPEMVAEDVTCGRVLVIDDDAAVGSALRLLLAEEHEVEVTGSARAALARLRAGEQFDVILCDLMMPELSGMDFYRELSERHPALAPLVIFLTGGAFTEGASEFLDRVPNARLSKPFQGSELRAVIARVRSAREG